MYQHKKIGQVKRSIADILEDFNEPVDPKIISKKPVFKRINGKLEKAGEVNFIAWYNLISELYRICPGWSWEIRTQFWTDRCVVEGRLTVRAAEGEFYMESTGVEPLDSDGFGDPVYSAESSALRRAMAKFGYGLDLWRKDKKVISSAPEKLIANGQKLKANESFLPSSSIKTPEDLNQKTITQKQISLLYAIAKKESGLAEEDLKLIIKAWGYESTKDIAIANFDSILTAVKNAAKYLTIAQRRELQQWWRTENISDSVAKRAISGMGFDSTANILRSQINEVKSGILEGSLATN